MKRLNNLYDNTYNLDNIMKMTDRVCTRVNNKEKVARFEIYKSEHIVNIYNRLKNRNFELGKYNIFMITDPKCRIVMAQEIEDKIVNHLISEYNLVKTFEPKFTNSMIATRVGKGTLYGVKLLKKYLNEMKENYDNFYVLKIDISKYFYSMDHNVLKNILRRKIKDKDALSVLFKIIDSTNEDYINKKIITLKNNRINYLKNSNLTDKDNLIQETEEVPLYKHGRGCAIGNQSSQAFGLIYLYELVHFIKEKLGIKHLCVYMDDFIIIHNDKEYLKKCLKIIKYKLENEFNLKINHKKTKIDSIKDGIDFLGYNFYIKDGKVILKHRNRTKRKFKKKIKDLTELRNYKYISSKEFNELSASYNGVLKWGDCGSLRYNCFK